MKRKMCVIISILMAVLLLAGCVSQEKYKAAQNNVTQLEQELSMQKTEIVALEQQLKEKENTIADLQTDYSGLSAKLNLFNIEQESLSEELDKLKSKYPPKYFPSTQELQKWVNSQPTKPFNRANTISMWETSIKDGWLTFFSFYWDEQEYLYVLSNKAILEDGDVYLWFCDDHSIQYCGSIYEVP